MRHKNYVDIRGLSFDEFVAFLFSREIPSESFASLYAKGETEKWNPWYRDTVVTFDPTRVCSDYVQLFQAPKFLLDTYSKDQLEQVFLAVQSRLNCSAFSIIWDRDLPFESGKQCVSSMFVLFGDVFARNSLKFAMQQRVSWGFAF